MLGRTRRLSSTIFKLAALESAIQQKIRKVQSVYQRLETEKPFRAEYMLDVIGAGATAVSDRDWHEVWRNSKESKALEEEIEQIHTEGRKHPPVAPSVQTQFATPWMYQTRELFTRQHLAYWRDPTYLMSKLSLNIIGGLFIGFTFFKAKNTIQGTQNKLFVSLIYPEPCLC